MAAERDRFVVFHVPRDQVGKLRTLVHVQDWYDGADLTISKNQDFIVGGFISTQRANAELETLFDHIKLFGRQLRSIRSKRYRPRRLV